MHRQTHRMPQMYNIFGEGIVVYILRVIPTECAVFNSWPNVVHCLYVVLCYRFKFGKAVVIFLVQTISCLAGCLSSNLDSHSSITFIAFQSHPMECFSLVLPYYLGCCLYLCPVGRIFSLLLCMFIILQYFIY